MGFLLLLGRKKKISQFTSLRAFVKLSLLPRKVNLFAEFINKFKLELFTDLPQPLLISI